MTYAGKPHDHAGVACCVSISSTQQTRHMTVTGTPVPHPGAGGSMDTQNGHPFRHHTPTLLAAWPMKCAGTVLRSLLSPPNHHQPTIREACRLHSRGSQRYLVDTAALLGVPNTHPQHAIGLGRSPPAHTGKQGAWRRCTVAGVSAIPL